MGYTEKDLIELLSKADLRTSRTGTCHYPGLTRIRMLLEQGDDALFARADSLPEQQKIIF
jgi:hypothetical protein